MPSLTPWILQRKGGQYDILACFRIITADDTLPIEQLPSSSLLSKPSYGSCTEHWYQNIARCGLLIVLHTSLDKARYTGAEQQPTSENFHERLSLAPPLRHLI
ncbi:hypothetical protein Y032_0118g766 [Ancylostoma ceylanicum]|uniref:Uncharacterized protein n=1 Tax=Ancylostoma ceylanicum TaxID=53326 RepID=A0A016TBN7_9BILA|nr:hypothetical protein Y032_0118g766 [Ancylostoma ceylanicum]